MICLNSKHDIEVYLKNSYRILNQQFYNKQLPDCVLKVDYIDKHETRESKIIFDVWSDNSQNKLSEITLSTNFFYTDSKGFINHESVVVELLINMCLLYCFENSIKGTSRNDTYFNKTFYKECIKHGLIEDINKNEAEKRHNGFKWYKLSPNFPSSLLDGFTAKSYLIRENKNSNGKKHSSIKYFCPKCNNSVRATKKVNILCSDCSCKMITKEDSLKNDLKETAAKDFKNVDLLDKLFYNPNYGVLVPEDIIAHPKGGLRYVCSFNIIDCFKEFTENSNKNTPLENINQNIQTLSNNIKKLSLKNSQNQSKLEDEQILREKDKIDFSDKKEVKVTSNSNKEVKVTSNKEENKISFSSTLTEQDLINMNPTYMFSFNKKKYKDTEIKVTNYYFLIKTEDGQEYYQIWAKKAKESKDNNQNWKYMLIDVDDFQNVSETYWVVDDNGTFYTRFNGAIVEKASSNNDRKYKLLRYITLRNGMLDDFLKTHPKRTKKNIRVLIKRTKLLNDARRYNIHFGNEAEVRKRIEYAIKKKKKSNNGKNSENNSKIKQNKELNFKEMRERAKAIPEEEKIKQGEEILSEEF